MKFILCEVFFIFPPPFDFIPRILLMLVNTTTGKFDENQD